MGDNTFKCFVFFMQKGGVGKTTITSVVAYSLARFGKTLMIDADQQGNLTMLFDPDFASASKKDFLSVLKEETSLKDAIRKEREESDTCKGLYLLGTSKNDSDLRKYMETDFRDDPYVIKTLTQKVQELGFNYLLFDLPPSYGFYEKIILSQATEIVPVVEPEDFAIGSLLDLSKALNKLKVQYDGNFANCRYLVINKIDKAKIVHNFYTTQLRSSPFEVFEIHDSKAISNAIAHHITMQEYDPNNPLCKTIEDLTNKIK